MTDHDPTYVWRPGLRPPKPGDHRPNLGGITFYIIKCDGCKRHLGSTLSLSRSAQGGLCASCREGNRE